MLTRFLMVFCAITLFAISVTPADAGPLRRLRERRRQPVVTNSAMVEVPPVEPTRVSVRSPNEELLTKPISASFDNVPLHTVIADLQALTGLPIVADRPALKEAGVSLDAPINLHLEKVSLRSALNIALESSKLACVMRDDVCYITTREKARGRMRQVVYPVADLVVPVADRVLTVGKAAPIDKALPADRTQEDLLIKLISTTVAPNSWSDNGGRGTIQYFPLGMALVVIQTAETQEEVAALLAALRRLQDLSVRMEVKVVEVSDAVLEKLHRECLHEKSTADGAPAILTEAQVKEVINLVQSDRATNIMQAPAMTGFNGQKISFEALDKQKFDDEEVEIGLRMSLCPIVAADRRSVRIDMDFQQTSLTPKSESAPMKRSVTHQIEKKLNIPVGRTALLVGGATVLEEVRSEFRHPILGRVPFLGRLFITNVGYGREGRHTLVLVTPTVIVSEEEEVRK